MDGWGPSLCCTYQNTLKSLYRLYISASENMPITIYNKCISPHSITWFLFAVASQVQTDITYPHTYCAARAPDRAG